MTPIQTVLAFVTLASFGLYVAFEAGWLVILIDRS